MSTPALTSRIRDVVAPVVSAAGLYLEAIEVAPAGRRSVVRLVIDLEADAEGGLDLDRLAEVSRDVSTALDDAETVPGEYTLEVSTPGVGRPLTERRHFSRARGRLVQLVLKDGSTTAGRLVGLHGEVLELSTEAQGKRAAEEIEVPLAEVVRGHIEVELSRAGDSELPFDDDDDNDTEA